MKFHVFVSGDRSVGLQEIHAVVTFEDHIIWDADMIAHQRGLLSEFYETPIQYVATDQEYQQEVERENKHFNLL